MLWEFLKRYWTEYRHTCLHVVLMIDSQVQKRPLAFAEIMKNKQLISNFENYI